MSDSEQDIIEKKGAARTSPQHRTRVERSEPGATVLSAEFGIDWTDHGPDGAEGVRVVVGWSEEDNAWLATLTGCTASDRVLATGDTKEAALLDLAASLSCLADACYAWWQEAEGKLRGAEPKASTTPPDTAAASNRERT